MVTILQRLIDRGRRALGITVLPELDERLSGRERVFRAPPLTRELTDAIKLISPQFDLTPGERSRRYWEADQNGACWGEYEALEGFFASMPRPRRVLEIGPGLGRSLVFFSRKLGWDDIELHAYEGEGETTKYTVLGPRFDDSFCGNIRMLRRVLEFNGIGNVTIFDAHDLDMRQLPGPYDFIWSFYSVGFHWALEHFLDDLLHLMSDAAAAVFTVPNEFEPFPELEGLSFRIVAFKMVWPKDGYLKLLVIEKKTLPDR
ncbi:MAG: hypothetical protein KF868_21660 [Acidobacteria bacterium]|nr:hypothetical protein [Acidobacteriota bacterium]